MPIKLLIKIKLLPIFLLGFLILYPFVFIWQGGDLTDAGYHATNFRFFFKSLALEETNSLTFLTDWIGGCWMAVFPRLGIIGLKFLYLLFLYTSFFFTYKILRPFIPNRNILFLLLIVGIIFSTRYTMFVFSHDIASWTFLTMSIYFFTKKTFKSRYFILSGVFIGLAFLCRFADISILIFLPLSLLMAYLAKIKSIHQVMKKMVFWLIGFSSLVLGFLVVLWYFNALHTYILNLGFFHFSMEVDAENSYSAMALMKNYFHEFMEFVPHALAVILGYYFLTIASKWKNKCFSVPFVLFLLFLTVNYYFGFSYSSKFRFLVPALCFPILFWIIRTRDSLAYLSLVVLAFTFTQVIGTNTGLLLKMNFGFSLLIPISLYYLYKQEAFFFKKFSLRAKPILLFAFLIISTIGFTARVGWIFNVDYGFPCRLRARVPAPHPKMKWIRTTYYQAEIIQDMTRLVDRNMDTNSTLFIYGHKPMLYYLTGNYPAISEYWLGNNVYTVEQVFNALERSIVKNNKWPVIVDTGLHPLKEDGEKAMSEFLKKHQYQMVENIPKKILVWKKL